MRGTSSRFALCTLCAIWLTSADAPARDLGVDVSHFQGSSGIPQSNWNQMVTEGRTFAFIKATEGLTDADDATMSTNVQRATTAGLLNGVYHLCHPENRPTTAGAILEADHFTSYAGSAIGPGHLRPVLDLEFGSGLSTTALTDWVLAFVNEVMAVDGASAEPIIYTTSGFAVGELDNRVSGLDLWIRGNFGDPQTGNPSTTGQFSNWAFWQYNIGTAGGVSPIDLDVVHTESAPLASFVIIPEPGSVMLLAGAGLVRAARRRRRWGKADASNPQQQTLR